MDFKEILGNRIKEVRISKSLKQEEVANAISSTKSTISKLESGQRAASIEYLVALADYFNVSLDYLIGRDDIPNRKESTHE